MGGSSGGGGGGTGVVDYPSYMKDFHGDLLNHTGTDTITSSLIDVMNTALGNSPFSGETAYDPDADIAAYQASTTAFSAVLAGINEITDWVAAYTQANTSIVIADKTIADKAVADKTIVDKSLTSIVAPIVIADKTYIPASISDKSIADKNLTGITDAAILADSISFGASLDDRITSTVLPRFQSGMLDINAVVSSAFPIGQAIIEAFETRDVAKHESGLRVEAAVKNADIDSQEQKMNMDKDVALANINITKDTAISNMNIVNRTDTDRMNLNKTIEVGKMELSVDFKNAEIESKEVTMNMDKDIAIANMNITKSVSEANMNLTKDSNISNMNLSKDIKIENMKALAVGEMIRYLIQKYSWQEMTNKTVLEGYRIKIVAKKEEADVNLDIDESDASWDLGIFQHGGNLLAGIGGGTVVADKKKKSQASSVLGGALTGAAAGAMVASGPMGWVIGGLLGAASGFL